MITELRNHVSSMIIRAYCLEFLGSVKERKGAEEEPNGFPYLKYRAKSLGRSKQLEFKGWNSREERTVKSSQRSTEVSLEYLAQSS